MNAAANGDRRRIDKTRHNLAVGLVGGPTIVVDYGGTRFLTDPTFDPPGQHGSYSKTEGPAVSSAALGPIDIVLLSHADHADNLDDAGRAVALAAPRLITSTHSATLLAGAEGLTAGQSTTASRAGDAGDIRITAVEAIHGPLDGVLDDTGHINAEVIGFVLASDGLPTVYLSGDNASLSPIETIKSSFGPIDIAIIHGGAARVPAKFDGRPLTATSERMADIALLLGASKVVPAHYRGWSIYSESGADIERAFRDAGISDRLAISEPGTWVIVE